MTLSTKLDEKLEGADNFRAWKYRVMLILEEHDLEGFIEADIPEPKGDEAKAKHKKSFINAKNDYCRFYQGSLDPSCVTLKDTKKKV